MFAIGFPSIYKQGSGLLEHLGELVLPFGQKPLIVCDQFVKTNYGDTISRSMQAANLDVTFDDFSGECSPQAVASAVERVRSKDLDCVIGLGGGKAIDAAKAVKIDTGVPVIVVPTIASNDSPTSRLAIMYDEDGKFLGPKFLTTNPDAIFVDTEVVAKAPVRFFRAGIADALATKFEADQVRLAGKNNFFDAQPTETAICLADHCYTVLRTHGGAAVRDVLNTQTSPAVEKVVEANILLSGLGFEGCGVAGAHAIGMALSVLPQAKGILHGEEVAIGLLAQFALEGRDNAFMADILNFYEEVGLPRCLRDVGLIDLSHEDLRQIAVFATRQGSRIHNMQHPVSTLDVYDALRGLAGSSQPFRATLLP